MAQDGRDPTVVAIGERVRQRRRELEMTQEALASAAGLSKSFVSEVEGGQASASGVMYLRLASALAVSVQWIMTGEAPDRPVASEVKISPQVAELADELGWTYSETADVAAALQSVVARRSRGGFQPGREEIIALANAVRALGPARRPGRGTK